MPLRASGLKGFFQKHNHLLAYLGTLLIILTFIAKEGFLDHWQRVADAIDLAQYIYSLRIDTTEENQRLEEMRKRLFEQKKRSRVKGSPSDQAVLSELEIEAAAEQTPVLLANIQASISNIDILLEKLPSDGDLEKKAAVFKKASTDADQEKHSIEIVKGLFDGIPTEQWKYASSEVSISGYHVDPSADPAGARLADLRYSLEALNWDLHDFHQEILGEAKSVKATNERRAEYAFWISTFLFILGGGVGLLAKIYGVPGVGEE